MLLSSGIDPGTGLVYHGLLLIKLLPADRSGRRGIDGPVPGEVDPGQPELGLVEIDLALSLVELGLVGPGIDLEQQVPLLDLGPFLERHLDQVTGHLGDDVIGIDSLRLPGEFHVVGDFPLDRLADRHRRRLDRARLWSHLTGNRSRQPSKRRQHRTRPKLAGMAPRAGSRIPRESVGVDAHASAALEGRKRGWRPIIVRTSQAAMSHESLQEYLQKLREFPLLPGQSRVNNNAIPA